MWLTCRPKVFSVCWEPWCTSPPSHPVNGAVMECCPWRPISLPSSFSSQCIQGQSWPSSSCLLLRATGQSGRSSHLREETLHWRRCVCWSNWVHFNILEHVFMWLFMTLSPLHFRGKCNALFLLAITQVLLLCRFYIKKIYNNPQILEPKYEFKFVQQNFFYATLIIVNNM